MVVAQLTEGSLLIPEVHGSNVAIGKNSIINIFIVEEMKIKEKEARNGPFLKRISFVQKLRHLSPPSKCCHSPFANLEFVLFCEDSRSVWE